ncbi:GLPGLI family protein [Chitinophaga sp. Mgbs1]|uniref:GLPGLI family protein n=1 Tax=Chitinophaga solisilvae TaxID=1233460 RepID=A0A9Q5GSH8_9BACT|nr:GLPGLI family protein [Chitinophaga solisilvae]
MKYMMLLLVILHSISTPAQPILTNGKIVFEKKTNITRIDQEEGRSFSHSNQPLQFSISYYELLFTNSRSIYQPQKTGFREASPSWWNITSENNTYTDFSRGIFLSRKKIFDLDLTVLDSIAHINWKISSDTRIICGILCRKATCILMDSLIIIAFYTDRISTTGGPESFTGLPGMILGLAIPKLHTTWYATGIQQISSQETLNISSIEAIEIYKKDRTNKVNAGQI